MQLAIYNQELDTVVSKYIWDLKESDTDFSIKWLIVMHVRSYRGNPSCCYLCLMEKLCILSADKSTLLNKRSELITKCGHENKFNAVTVRGYANVCHSTVTVRCFINVFSRRATVFHNWAKGFELNFFVREISLHCQTGQANHPYSQSISLGEIPALWRKTKWLFSFAVKEHMQLNPGTLSYLAQVYLTNIQCYENFLLSQLQQD